MNISVPPARTAPDDLGPGKFAVGQSVSRLEDPVLLRGEGRYSDDLNLPGQVHAVMVRSRVAHGTLRGVDTAEAASMPGVLGVYLAADLQAAGIAKMQANVTGANHDGRPVPKPEQWALATDRVRYVGHPIAVVVAETAKQAKDAAEAVMPDIDPLPAVTDAAAAAAPGAPAVYDEVPDNVVLDWKFGDESLVAQAFSRAAHVTRLSIRNNRVVVAPMEPRAAIGEYTDGRFVLRVGSQGTFGLRNAVRAVMGVPVDKVRVLTGNVGGSFGMKAQPFPEYVCLLHAARTLGRPV
jgi:carbon-monoxide dehydrogenase large subunit